MSEVLKQSLASWGEEHGFLVLCLIPPEGERFILAAPDAAKAASLSARGFRFQAAMSADEMHAHLIDVGVSGHETTEAIDLARVWATTVTRGPGSPPVLWKLPS
jgi:hypothetical protein